MTIDLNLLMHAYAHGYFPMSDSRDDEEIFWVEPKRRAILPLEGLHISKSLAKTVRQDRFRVTTDTAFEQVIARCAESASDREDTWINSQIEDAFVKLHRLGHTHSVECWLEGDNGMQLVGGLYGLALGGAFFGESMFSREADASKVALVWLVAHLRAAGFKLLDCQFITDHLTSLGAMEIPQAEYLEKLADVTSGLADQASVAPSSTGSSAAGVAGVSGAGLVGDWGAADGFLGAALSEDGGGGGNSSSPGKRILHSLTHTS